MTTIILSLALFFLLLVDLLEFALLVHECFVVVSLVVDVEMVVDDMEMVAEIAGIIVANLEMAVSYFETVVDVVESVVDVFESVVDLVGYLDYVGLRAVFVVVDLALVDSEYDVDEVVLVEIPVVVLVTFLHLDVGFFLAPHMVLILKLVLQELEETDQLDIPACCAGCRA